MTESTGMFDSLAVVARDKNGRVKDARFVRPFAGKIWQFHPNRLYLRLVNDGDIQPDTFKIPFIFGSWSVVHA